jgi:citrate lyase subunit gamma (acyl carrier protein)
MELKKVGIAGTLESSDIMVTIKKNDKKCINIQLTSSVEKQFGNEIRKVIADTLEKLGINSAEVEAVDKGALDCTVRARVKTAAFRACEGADSFWRAE